MGEKFAANPATGTGSLSVPITTSPGRSGFGPQISLSYDSGAGNGPFGLGWTLSLPSITRKTDKGLPRYLDAIESDVFIVSGSEDLVPVLAEQPNGDWIDEPVPNRFIGVDEYRVKRYRPRIEGLYARLERWSHVNVLEDVFWRSISRDNITTWYGRTAESRIADPADRKRIFSWLICESRDDRGNAVVYEYQHEDNREIVGTQAHERHRQAVVDSRTANRYIKRIKYGNRTSHLVAPDVSLTKWLFEVVFDYGERHYTETAPDADSNVFADAAIAAAGPWPVRRDPFSSYRGGFDLRTYRVCQRILMFHHFDELKAESGTDGYLVRSTEFQYRPTPIATFLESVTQSGFVWDDGQHKYLKRSMPPVEFTYSEVPTPAQLAVAPVRALDADSMENLPTGLSGAQYQWVDLDGEGVSGILSEHATVWHYKPNLGDAQFGALETVAAKPSMAAPEAGQQLLDLRGDGQLDLVDFGGTLAGFYERTFDRGWEDFRAFVHRPNIDWANPNLRFVDLDGDGHADILITEDAVLSWYPSLAEEGFAPLCQVRQAADEDRGPRVLFADGTQSVLLADMSGDGLTDLVRVRNGEICYWPNLGYGKFGAKVTMDHSPVFDTPETFDQRRIRATDIDGSGVTDILYLAADGVRVYYNESGNRWSDPQLLPLIAGIDNLASVTTVDLFGNGTACLVWSSPQQAHANRPLAYIDLMGGQKPHLLVRTVNNLGAETHVSYAASTKFYLQDKREGKPWITRLPFPVHVVEKVETFDRVSRNRFVSRFAYHHGYFDGVEREFRGFGMVEQWDTELFAALTNSDLFPVGTNVDAVSHVPPVHTKTWFHTGAYVGRDHVSNFFAGFLSPGARGEYYREPGLGDADARALLLPDTTLPAGLGADEEREACRALKGAMLRQEVYGLDESAAAPHPYSVSEQRLALHRLQPRAKNRHAVFATQSSESIVFNYDRNPADPRISHKLVLEVDRFGNVLKEAAIAYGRRGTIRVVDEHGNVQQVSNSTLNGLHVLDQPKQRDPLITYSEHRVTMPVREPDAHRVPLPCEGSSYQLTGFAPSGVGGRFQAADLVAPDPIDAARLRLVFNSEIAFEQDATTGRQRRPIERLRTLYRKNDLTGLLPLGQLESLALPGESYKLALTPGLLSQVFQRPRTGQSAEALLPAPGDVLAGSGRDRGGYVSTQSLKGDGRFPTTDPDDHWWLPAGRVFMSQDPADLPIVELTRAREHFFLPVRYQDPFGEHSLVRFDASDLLMVASRDPLGNEVTVDVSDYRVLQPRVVSDPNRNQSTVAFDALGMVVGAAVMGKPLPARIEGDDLAGFVADLPESVVLDHIANPLANPGAVLRRATMRLIYDVFAYHRTRHTPNPQTSVVYTIARETHVADGPATRFQHSFAYSDGFGRHIQTTRQAEREIVNGVAGPARWVGSGWLIFNNKGKPVRQYEPYFTNSHAFQFAHVVGVSSVLFYDPIGRVVATLHPDHTFEKVVFEAWRQIVYDANDTVAARDAETGDPRTDAHIAGYVKEFFKSQSTAWQTWYQERIGGLRGAEQANAAQKAARHANTPTLLQFDVLGRSFITETRNRYDRNATTVDEVYLTRVTLDINGRQRDVRDPVIQAGDLRGRVVMRSVFDMLGNLIHQSNVESGQRWTLHDVRGKSIRAWDSRGHNYVTAFDALRRPIEQYVRGTSSESDPRTLNRDVLVDRIEYGEGQANDVALNLRTRVYRHFDSAGIVTNAAPDPLSGDIEAFDFKGNLKRHTRQLAADYTAVCDWLLPPALSAEVFATSSRYDAMNRAIQTIVPRTDQTRTAGNVNVLQPTFNEANLLERVDVWLGRAPEPAARLDPAAEPPSLAGIGNIDYNARGQRLRIDYRNGASTAYAYDAATFRLTHLYTRRGAAFTGDCDNPLPAPATIAAPDQPPAAVSCGLQQLHYAYDPAGNITQIRDAAQQTIYFRNKRVEPSADYTYDAVYRLIAASGREHLGQLGGAPIAHSHSDAPRAGIQWAANDGNAMGTYTERYVYDAGGNLQEIQHSGDDPQHPGWTRTYDYLEPSLLEPAPKQSNRLTQTTVSTNSLAPDRYRYDPHGNIVRMPHLAGAEPDANMHWDHRDRLRRVDLGGGGVAYYAYGAGSTRVRKVWEKSPGEIEERIYLGGFEIFRRRNGTGVVTLERETLHVMDDQQRVALVETRVIGVDPGPEQLIRYQLTSQVGSSCVELDDQAEVISYEEYTPFGSTSYQAVRSQTETPKRYRFTGKERDDESGLSFHGARFYATWLGRWISCDPLFTPSKSNLYAYVSNRPIVLVDDSGRSGNKPPNFTDAEIKAALDEGFEAKEGAMKRKRFSLDVDEKKAVKGSKAGGVSGSPTSAENKQLLDSTTNQQSKKNFVPSTPDVDVKPFDLPPVDAPEEVRRAAGEKIAVGGFDKPDELNELTSDIEDRQADKTKRSNAKIREAIREGDAPKTAASLDAAGIDPKTLTLQNPAGVPQFPDADMVQLTPKDVPVNPKTGLTKRAQDLLAAVADSRIVEDVLKSKGLKVVVAVAPILVSGVAKAAPVVGTAVGAADVANEASEGNARRAVLAGIGMSEIPIVSQVADIGLAVEDAGWVAKDILDPEMKLEMWYYNTFLK